MQNSVVPASECVDAISPQAYSLTESRDVDETAIDTFERDGVVCLRRVLDSDRTTALLAAADRSTQTPGPLGYRIGTPGEHGFFYYDFQLHERHEAFRWLVYESGIPALGARLMRSPGVTLYYSNLFVKDRGSRADSPWHEDASYSRIDGLQCINLWIALDRIPAETALVFKAGSHLRSDPIYLPRHFDPSVEYDQGVSRGRVPMPAFEEIDRSFPTVFWEMEPGDAVVFTQRTLHGAPGNTLDTCRRAAALLLIGDKATYNDDPGRTDPPFRDDSKRGGEHPAGDVFPRLL